MKSISEAAREVVPESDRYSRLLYMADLLRGGIILDALRSLGIAKGSSGLDAGCGIGTITLFAVKELAREGHATGIDISPGMVSCARAIAERCALSERADFSPGDIKKLPFDDACFDWVISVDCALYPSDPSPVETVLELARVLKPGGILAVLGWSYQQLLPGHAGLEARLNTVSSLVTHGGGPDSSFMRSLSWLSRAGLEECRGRTFIGEAQAPLGPETVEALHEFFDMLWGEAKGRVSEGDWSEYERLCSRESSDYILGLPGYYAFFAYTMFSARKPLWQ